MTTEEAIEKIASVTGIDRAIVEYDLSVLLSNGLLVFGNMSISVEDGADMGAVVKAMIAAYKHTDVSLDKSNGVSIQIWD